MKIEIKIKKKNEEKNFSIKEFVGKKVYSKSANYVGKISDIFLSKKNLKYIKIISKDKGEILLDIEFFDFNYERNIFLDIDPISSL